MTDKVVPDALTQPKSVTGILWHVTGMVLFASMDAVSKHLVVGLPVVEILWVRYVFFFLFGLALALRLEGWSAFKTKAPGLQIVRGLTLVAEIGLFTYALRYLKLVDAHVMAAMTPLMVMALAVPMLGERVGIRRWAAVSVGFLGVLIILRPGLAVIDPIQIVPLIGAGCFALYLVLTRMVARQDTIGTSTLYTGLVGFLVLSLAVPTDWQPPTPDQWGWLLVASFLGIGAHVSVIKALSMSEASALQPFNHTMLVWATLIGFLAFDDLPDGFTMAGAGVIVLSGLYAWYRERTREKAIGNAGILIDPVGLGVTGGRRHRILE
ncbi:MAG: DMT family transporter [Alphaproteobacteria bacterium]|nr:DMT family transporter [Alphaproteobacteria bacterium]